MPHAGRKPLGSGEPPTERPECPDCNPPQLAAADRAKHRYRHYLSFPRAGDLEEHLRAQPRQPDPVMGYGFEDWLRGVVEWYRLRKMRERSDEDLARFRNTQVAP